MGVDNHPNPLSMLAANANHVCKDLSGSNDALLEERCSSDDEEKLLQKHTMESQSVECLSSSTNLSPLREGHGLHENLSPPPLEHHIRQESWYQEMLDQGLSSRDIAGLLGCEDDDQRLEQKPITDEAVLDQRRILAISEAHKRLKQRTGRTCPPADRAVSLETTTQQQHVLFPPTEPMFAATTPARISKPTRLFSFDPQTLIDQPMTRQPDLYTATPLHKPSKVPDGFVVVRCLGCRKPQTVSRLATLVRCSLCSTVSPTSTTRK